MKAKPWLFVMVMLVAVISAVNIFVAIHGAQISPGAKWLWYVTFSYFVALVVEADRKSRKLSAPYEYGAFVFFGWPLAVPYYLYTVYGWRGIALGLGFWLFSLIPDVAYIATYLVVPE